MTEQIFWVITRLAVHLPFIVAALLPLLSRLLLLILLRVRSASDDYGARVGRIGDAADEEFFRLNSHGEVAR